MISYALDANAVIGVLSGRSAKLTARFFACDPGAACIPTIVAHELYFGAYRSQRMKHNLSIFRRFANDAPVLEFDQNDARISGEIRATLISRGMPIGPYDILIAGQAKARGLTVVTNNVREFSRVAGLSVEDWTL